MSPTSSTAQADPETLHDALLRAFLDPALNIAAIAEHFALSLVAVLQWFNSERARRDLDALGELARYRARLLADLGLPAAVDTLNRVNADLAATQPAEDEPLATRLRLADTARKTATAIQRLSTPRARREPIPTGIVPPVAASDERSDPAPERGERAAPDDSTSQSVITAPPTRARDRPAHRAPIAAAA